MDLPKSVGKMSKKECSELLRKALIDSGIKSQMELSRLTGIPGTTIGGYFNAVYPPPQENWNTLREYLCPDENAETKVTLSKNEQEGAEYHAKRIKAQIFLLQDDLNFFKDQPKEARDILKKIIDTKEAGYTISLFKALFDEEELDIWKSF